jgi:HK97 family phage major capsid protein
MEVSMTEQIKRLRERRLHVWEHAKAIADRAASENRALDGEEQRTWERLNKELDDADDRIKELVDKEERARAQERTMSDLRGSGSGWSASDAELEEEFRQVIRDNSGKPIEVSNPRRTVAEQRTLSSTGLVPTSFYDQIVRHMVDGSGVLAAGATRLNSETGEPIKIPKSSAFSSSVIVSETSTIPVSEPTLGTVQLGAYKYGFRTEVSYELAQDNTFDLLGFLAEQAGTSIGLGWGAHALTGTGTGQPKGVVLDATSGASVANATFTTTGADGLVDLAHSISEPYARSKSAAWIMKNATLGSVRKLKASGTGEYLFSPDVSPSSGASGTLLGKPVYTDTFAATLTAGQKPVVYGDWSKVFVRLAGGLRWEQSTDFAFDRDVVSFRGLSRIDSALIDTTGAIKFLTVT